MALCSHWFVLIEKLEFFNKQLQGFIISLMQVYIFFKNDESSLILVHSCDIRVT